MYGSRTKQSVGTAVNEQNAALSLIPTPEAKVSSDIRVLTGCDGLTTKDVLSEDQGCEAELWVCTRDLLYRRTVLNSLKGSHYSLR